jgi:hypothetical protein
MSESTVKTILHSMECIHCGSDRVLEISAKCNDKCILEFKGMEHQGYVPENLAIGGADYIEIDICLNCGIAQGLSDEPDPDFYTKSQITNHGEISYV